MKRVAAWNRISPRQLFLAVCVFAVAPLAGCDDSTIQPLDTATLLSSLVISSGSLAPVFSSTELTYTATVTNATTSITLTPRAVNSASTIKVNGVTIASGATTAPINLSTGTNALTISVTSTANKTSTYLVTVTRALS